MENKIDVSVAQETQTQVLQELATLKALMPFLIKLSKKQRDALHKLSDGRKPFVEKGLYYGTSNTELNPGEEMLDACNNDFSLYTFLNNVEQELLQLLEMVHDTKQLAGAEALTVASYIYSVAKLKLKLGAPGMQSVVDDLGKLFEQTSGTDAEEASK
jgi:hypothetical protein